MRLRSLPSAVVNVRLYPIRLFTCLNIYFVNRDVSVFFLLSPPPPTGADGRGTPSPPLSILPHPPLSPPAAQGDPTPKGPSPTGGAPTRGREGREREEEVSASLAYLVHFSGTQQNSGTPGGWARPLRPAFLCRVSPTELHPSGPMLPVPPKAGVPCRCAPGRSGLLPVRSWDPPPILPASTALPEMQASRLLIEELNSRVLLGNWLLGAAQGELM